MSAPTLIQIKDFSAPTQQRICGWCAMELSPGTQPATTGICPRCYVRLEMDAKRNTD